MRPDDTILDAESDADRARWSERMRDALEGAEDDRVAVRLTGEEAPCSE